MSTPEELLCSKKWRFSRGLWMLFGWIPFALTAWIGYLIIGIKARNWKWILISVSFFAWGVAWSVWSGSLPTTTKGETVPEENLLGLNLWAISGLVVWLGNAIGLQWWVNRRWLVWRAHHDKGTPWYAEVTRTNQAPNANPASTSVDNAFASLSGSSLREAGSGTNEVAPVSDAAPHHGGDAASVLKPIELNSATNAELAALPGLDAESASRIIATRSRIGGFDEISDLVTLAGIKPHELAAFQNLIEVADRSASGTTKPPGSELPRPPEGGRRLEF